MDFPSMVYERLELARRGQNPTLISRMCSGWLVLGDNQNIPGYCVFLADPMVDEIHQLGIEARVAFLRDMTLAGEAIQAALQARLVNYSILGNADTGLHAHIHPRYSWESDRFRTKNPFKYYWENVPDVPFDEETHRGVILSIRKELERSATQGKGSGLL